MSADTLSIRAEATFADFGLDVAQDLALEGVTAVFGPSGAGKSTLLRMIAGFERPSRGEIAWRSRTWCDTARNIFVPPHRRPVGFVFQDARLFPHLTVHGNLTYAERRASRDGAGHAASEIIDAFGLEALLDRRPTTLSGGERQRVGLARALLTRPDLVLLDEPLSGLDQTRKMEILPLLADLPARFGAPILYVSHDLDEVCRIADQVMILRAGQVAALGPTTETLNRYGFDIDDVSAGAVLQGVIAGHAPDKGLTDVSISGQSIRIPLREELRTGHRIRLRVPAKDVVIATAKPENLSIRNVLPAKILKMAESHAAPFFDLRLDVGGQQIVSRVSRDAAEELGLALGQEVYALIKSASLQR